jgi:hypothetical protein
MKIPAGAIALSLLGGAGAALWGVAGWRATHPPLEEPLKQALAGVLRVDPQAISVARVRLALPSRLVIDELSTGELAAREIVVEVDPWALLGGKVRLGRVRARDVVSELGRVDEVEATLAPHRQARVALRHATLAADAHWLGELGVSVGEIGLEVQGGALKRLAFAGARVGGVADLAGSAVRGPDGAWLIRAARAGLTATARLDGDRVAGQARLDRFLLDGALAPRGLDLTHATATGELRLARERGAAARVEVRLAVDDVSLDAPALTRARLEHLSPSLTGELSADAGTLELHQLRIGLGAASVILDGRLDRSDDNHAFSLSATLPRLACRQLLAALPRPLVPHLDGLELDGDIAARVTAEGDAADWSALRLAVDGENSCRARVDAPLADVAALARPDAPLLRDRTVAGRGLPLTAANPSWRTLASLPPPLVRAFLAAEDGRFFVHHGFDVDRIRHALGADLDAGRFDRGASTITQQVAKNLFLSGERTLSRKLEEAVLAWRLEAVLDKRRILELYLNLVELGPGVYGVQEASERYFGKIPDELSSDEAAQLAALLPAPRRGMDAAWQRRYQALAARLPFEKVPMPVAAPPKPTVKLTRR